MFCLVCNLSCLSTASRSYTAPTTPSYAAVVPAACPSPLYPPPPSSRYGPDGQLVATLEEVPSKITGQMSFNAVRYFMGHTVGNEDTFDASICRFRVQRSQSLDNGIQRTTSRTDSDSCVMTLKAAYSLSVPKASLHRALKLVLGCVRPLTIRLH
jgi:hypothetical protein